MNIRERLKGIYRAYQVVEWEQYREGITARRKERLAGLSSYEQNLARAARDLTELGHRSPAGQASFKMGRALGCMPPPLRPILVFAAVFGASLQKQNGLE